MTGLYLIANAWGPRYGGINAFNTDFAKALGLALGRVAKVACIVLDADAPDIADAAGCQVALIPIGPSPDHDRFDPSRAHDCVAALQARELPVESAIWIGHDIVTGDVAVRLGELAPGSQVVLIHHMSYIDYQGYKHGVGQTAKQKHDRQRALFTRADRVYGVGPLLRDRLADMLDSGPGRGGHASCPACRRSSPAACRPPLPSAPSAGSTRRTTASSRGGSRLPDSRHCAARRANRGCPPCWRVRRGCTWSASPNQAAQRSRGCGSSPANGPAVAP